MLPSAPRAVSKRLLPLPRFNPSPSLVSGSVGKCVEHAKEAESQGFPARPTLASAAMPRWGMANVGETHLSAELLREGCLEVE